MMHMTIEDIAHEYAPYHTMPAFMQGVHDWQHRQACDARKFTGADEQAYDRGMECAMRVYRHTEWIKQNVGLN